MSNVYMGSMPMSSNTQGVKEGFTHINGELFYKIENYNEMDPFFMSITSSSNHWMFISSTGGLTTGRISAEYALFPYYTDDRVTENISNTGPKTKVLVEREGKVLLWEPFESSSLDYYRVERDIYKNVLGNKVIFSETNKDLGVTFTYQWSNSKEYGIIRTSQMVNNNSSDVSIRVLDGFINVLPAGVQSQVQNEFSCLLNGYKRTELEEKGLGLFTLSATLTDLAEPSESLRANTIWQTGLEPVNYLLSERQIESFRKGEELTTESDIKGDRGAYLLEAAFDLNANEEKEWMFICDVEKDLTDVVALKAFIDKDSYNTVVADVEKGSKTLRDILVQNDGIQVTESDMNSVHHEANIMYNIMRGGFFSDSYNISMVDFVNTIKISNVAVYEKFKNQLETLDEVVNYEVIETFVHEAGDVHLERIWNDYMPLTFSRRHGDPSRPWNRFSIQTETADGEAKLDYQGNWRDIFQNWEALCYSYPKYFKHAISKFLNASTMDGYNPYRVSKGGIDWECPEPDNPWANIGYWSDHQIIYLLKLLEVYRDHEPASLAGDLNKRIYTFANVPYKIKSFEEVVADPYDTIEFDEDKDEAVKTLAAKMGAEGKMLHKGEELVLASMTEKLLIHLLTKLGNYIPEGGIWMNTQRPEWNDANNALVGRGISVVTLAYVRRYLQFLKEVYSDNKGSYTVTKSLLNWFSSLKEIFSGYSQILDTPLKSDDRYNIVSRLGIASDKFRENYYGDLDLEDVTLSGDDLLTFFDAALLCVDDSLRKNKREDNLYHSYNTLEIKDGQLIIHYLYEMLEGQVAILSAGVLVPEDVVAVYRSLRSSSMFREDQHSYMLYPNRDLNRFCYKNTLTAEVVEKYPLLKELVSKGNRDLIAKDLKGDFHFNGDFKNVKDVTSTIEALGYDRDSEVEKLFETTFNHQAFTGRSGTFFAYEGLGSIYWHMVSKLLLAMQENIFWAQEKGADQKTVDAIIEAYKDVRDGIGYKKSGQVYGAFPFDPYSHTPFAKGAKQPGMTGQVKEEVITRLAEMGIRISGGEINFDKTLVDQSEFLTKESVLSVKTKTGDDLELTLPVGSMSGTHCQTPYIIKKADTDSIILHIKGEDPVVVDGNRLDGNYSSRIFDRDGDILYFEVTMVM